MERDFEIVKEKVQAVYIGDDGNLHSHANEERFVLKSKDNKTISHQYYCMIDLGNDHFAICDIRNNVRFFTDYNCYDIVKGDYEMTPLKWGVIRVTRDEEGKIIPGAEVEVIPCIYDRISENNLKTATAYNGDHLTYLDLDRERISYGHQLVPCVLNHAVPFGAKYENLAECSVNGITGYLPRNCSVKYSIESYDLLTKSQAIAVSNYLTDADASGLDNETLAAYNNLTGEMLLSEKAPQYQKKMSEEQK